MTTIIPQARTDATQLPGWVVDTHAARDAEFEFMHHVGAATVFEADAQSNDSACNGAKGLAIRPERTETALVDADGHLTDRLATGNVTIAGWLFPAAVAREIAGAILDAAEQAEN